MGLEIKLIVGLGNPGEKYYLHRHNVGFWFIDMLAKKYEISFKNQKKFNAAIAELPNKKCYIVKPTTFVNNSGMAVSQICNFYKIAPEHILIIHDELAFPVGRIKLKNGGGHNGHNGLKDISQALNSNSYLRLRIGIDHPQQKNLVSGYVLQPPSKKEQNAIIQEIGICLELMPSIIAGEITQTMNILNTKKPNDKS